MSSRDVRIVCPRLYWSGRLFAWSHCMLCRIVPYITWWSVWNRIALFTECVWNLMAYGDAREGKWRGNWRMEWVASTLHITSEHGVSSITNGDAHTSAASTRLSWSPHRFKWTRPFRRKTKLVSARVPSRFKRSIQHAVREICFSACNVCSFCTCAVPTYRCNYATKTRRDVLINVYSMKLTPLCLSLLLHRAFWRFTKYYTPTNAPIVYYILA